MSRQDDDERMMRFFEYVHLPYHLRTTSQAFALLAQQMMTLPPNAERTAMLRKLLEAKDCAVRAVIQGPDEGEYVA